LQRQIADRESKVTAMRIRTAHVPAVTTLEDFNLDHLLSLRRGLFAHLATSTFVAKAENVILLGPPGIGTTHLAIGLRVKACHAGYSVLFDTVSNWITPLAATHHAKRLEAEPKRSPLQAGPRRGGTRTRHVAGPPRYGHHLIRRRDDTTSSLRTCCRMACAARHAS
jgi:hypothetical protein